MAFDMDLSPYRRRNQPNFYGYIKDSSAAKALTFLSMMLLAVTHIISKTLVACLIIVSASAIWLAVFVASEFLVYISFKIVRRDFTYFIPTKRKLSAVVLSAFFRVVMKLLADFTGLLQLRYVSTLLKLSISHAPTYTLTNIQTSHFLS